MKKTILLLSVLFSACNAPQIRPMVRRVYSIEFQKCYCQFYDLNKMHPMNELEECEINYCDDLVGFSANDWASDITPWANEMYQWVEDSCR